MSRSVLPPGEDQKTSGIGLPAFIEELGRYIDGTLQDDVHGREIEFKRVPNSGRNDGYGWACDFDVLYQGQRTRITVSTTAASQ